jgi:protein SCO1/2
MVQVK